MSTSANLRDETVRESAAWLDTSLPGGLARGVRLCSDSRRLRVGDVFVAWPGAASDGRRHLGQAIAAGAAAMIVEAEGFDPASIPPGGRSVPLLPVTGLRGQAGRIASRWLGHPSASLDVVAVTGTNGKTSCTQWIASGFNARAGRDVAAVVGTLGAGLPGCLDTSAGLTTPDALELQHLFRAFVDAGLSVAAIEASSIGLVQGRLEGTQIAVAVITNLTRDHLDFHQTMQAYGDAKARLFQWPGLRAAVVNLDDAAALAISDALDAPVQRIAYGIVSSPEALASGRDCDAAVRQVLACPMADGVVRLSIGGQTASLRLALIGRFNLSNALAVAGVWHALGWSFDDIVAGLEGLRPVPGRLQVIGAPRTDLPMVVVDYAHTPDALVNVLATLREIADARGGRLWCVFGAGGNRDRGKRAPMAGAAEAAADELVLTSDNPRDEDPGAILDDLRAGLTRPARFIEADRGVAIDRAVALAAAPDIVLLAGKGHEAYQEVHGERRAFSDEASALAALAGRSGGDVLGGRRHVH